MKLAARITRPLAGLFLIQSIGSAQLEMYELPSPNGSAPWDYYARAVAVDAARTYVGAPRAGINEVGAVYVYDTESGILLSILQADDPFKRSEFGASLAVSDGRLLVGAPGDQDVGAAYLFDVRTGTQIRKLTDADKKPEDEFGAEVDLDGDLALIGAPQDDSVAHRAGSASVFDVVSGAQLHKLTASDGSFLDLFGWSLAIDTPWVVIGAIGDDDLGSSSGAAYVFDVASGAELRKLHSSEGKPSDSFGFSIDLQGTRAVIGSYRGDGAFPASGSAYLFDVTTGNSLLEFDDPGSDDGANFGASVGFSGRSVVVGAPNVGGPGSFRGAAYLFDATDSRARFRFEASDGEPFDQFGFAVAIHGERTVVGTTAASAYVNRAPGEPSIYCTAKTNSCGTLPGIGWTGFPSASASSGFNVVIDNTKAHRPGILLYSNWAKTAIPFQGGYLCMQTPFFRSIPLMDTAGTGSLCNGQLSLDMNAFAAGALGGNPQPFLRVAGSHVLVQLWARDDIPNGSLLSDALEYYVTL